MPGSDDIFTIGFIRSRVLGPNPHLLGWFNKRMRMPVDNGAHIKNTYEIVEIDSRPESDYSLSSRNLK